MDGVKIYSRQVFYHWHIPTHPVLEAEVFFSVPWLSKEMSPRGKHGCIYLPELSFFRKISLVWCVYSEEGALNYVCTRSRGSSHGQWCLNQAKGWVGVCGMDNGGGNIPGSRNGPYKGTEAPELEMFKGNSRMVLWKELVGESFIY